MPSFRRDNFLIALSALFLFFIVIGGSRFFIRPPAGQQPFLSQVLDLVTDGGASLPAGAFLEKKDGLNVFSIPATAAPAHVFVKAGSMVNVSLDASIVEVAQSDDVLVAKLKKSGKISFEYEDENRPEAVNPPDQSLFFGLLSTNYQIDPSSVQARIRKLDGTETPVNLDLSPNGELLSSLPEDLLKDGPLLVSYDYGSYGTEGMVVKEIPKNEEILQTETKKEKQDQEVRAEKLPADVFSLLQSIFSEIFRFFLNPKKQTRDPLAEILETITAPPDEELGIGNRELRKKEAKQEQDATGAKEPVINQPASPIETTTPAAVAESSASSTPPAEEINKAEEANKEAIKAEEQEKKEDKGEDKELNESKEKTEEIKEEKQEEELLPAATTPAVPEKPFFKDKLYSVTLPILGGGSQLFSIFSDGSVQAYEAANNPDTNTLTLTEISSWNPQFDQPLTITKSEASHSQAGQLATISLILRTREKQDINLTYTFGWDGKQYLKTVAYPLNPAPYNLPSLPTPDSGTWITAPNFKLHFSEAGIDQLYNDNYEQGRKNMVAPGQTLITGGNQQSGIINQSVEIIEDSTNKIKIRSSSIFYTIYFSGKLYAHDPNNQSLNLNLSPESPSLAFVQSGSAHLLDLVDLNPTQEFITNLQNDFQNPDTLEFITGQSACDPNGSCFNSEEGYYGMIAQEDKVEFWLDAPPSRFYPVFEVQNWHSKALPNFYAELEGIPLRPDIDYIIAFKNNTPPTDTQTSTLIFQYLGILDKKVRFYLDPNVTWTASGAGNWSTAANWSGGAVPGSGDIAIFSASSSAAVTIDANVNVAGIDIQSTYNGSLTQNTGITITVGSSNFAMASSTFSGGDSTIDINGAFTLSGGTFTSTSGTLSVSGAWTHTAGGTFTHNSGTVTADGTGSRTWNVNTSETFNNLTLNATGGAVLIVTIGDTLTVNGTFTWTDGAIHDGTIDAKGTVSVASTADGHSTNASSSLLQISGSGTQTCTLNGGGAVSRLTINNASSTCTVAGSGTFTVERTGGTGLTLTNGVFDGGSITVDLNGDVSITGGTFTSTSGSLLLAEDWSHTAGTFTHNSGSVTFDSATSATANVNISETFNNLTINKAAVLTVTAGDTLTVNGTFTWTNGSIDAGTIDAKGDVVVDSTADGQSSSSSTLQLTGTGTQTCTLTGTGRLSELLINNSSATCSTTGGGTITIEATTDSGALTVTAGTLNSSSTILDNDGGVTINGGTLVAPSSTLNVGGDWIYSSGTFTHNSGSVVFDQTGGGTIDSGTQAFNDVTFNRANSFGIVGTMDINGNLTITSVGSNLDTGTITVAGNLTSTDTVVDGTAAITLDGTGSQTINAADDGLPNGTFTINKSAGTATLAAALVLNDAGTDLTITSGTFDLASFNLTVNDVFTIGASGTIQWRGSETITRGSLSINNTGTVVYTGDGDGAADTFTITTLTANYGSLTASSTDGTTDTFQLGTNLNASSSITLSAGTFDVSTSNYSITVGGNWTDTGAGAFTPRSGTVTFGSSSAQTLNANDAFNHLTVNKPSGTVTLGGNLDVNGNLTLTSGTLDASTSNYNINLAGSWTNNATFTARSGTVTLDGTSQTLSGPTSFYNFTKTVTSAATLTFPSGSGNTQTITNTWTAQGASGQLLSLRSNVDGTQWRIDPQGTRTISYLDVKDSNNINATAIATAGLNITDSGNNTGWNFNSAPTATTPSLAENDDNGQVTITTTISDSDNNATRLKVEFSKDNGSTWLDPYLLSATASQGTANLDNSAAYQIGNSDRIDTNTANTTLDIVWDPRSSANQDGAISPGTEVLVRVTPNDTTVDGTASQSAALTLGGRGGGGVSFAPSAPAAPPPSAGGGAGTGLVEQIVGLFLPPPAPPPPITIPEEAPPALKGQWQLAVFRPLVEKFVLAPLPQELRDLAGKIPRLGETFERLGISRVTDVTHWQLTETKLNLPSLLPQGIPIARLSKEIIKKLPTNLVFARAADEKLDLNIKLALEPQGELRQTFNVIAGRPVQLVVKPDAPAKSVTGYVMLYPKKYFGSRPSIPLAQLTASVILPNLPELAEEQLEPVNERLVLEEFRYENVGNNVFKADIRSPVTVGQYQIVSVVEYREAARRPMEMKLVMVVDPEGYVYRQTAEGELRLAGAKVSIYEKTSSGWRLWPAKSFQQDNPQITDVTGRYSFLVPEGEYFLQAEVLGYEIYKGEPFTITLGGGVHTNIEMKRLSLFRKLWQWFMVK